MENIKITNNTDESIFIRLFKVNMVQEIKANDYLMLTIKSDEDKEYYEDIASELGLEIEGEEPTPGYDNTLYYEINEQVAFSYRIKASGQVMEAGQGTIEYEFMNLTLDWDPNYIISFTDIDSNKVTKLPGEGGASEYYLEDITELSLQTLLEQIIQSVVSFINNDYTRTLQEKDVEENLLYEMTATASAELYSTHSGLITYTVHNNTADKTLVNNSLSSLELPAGETTTLQDSATDIYTPQDIDDKITTIFNAFYLDN